LHIAETGYIIEFTAYIFKYEGDKMIYKTVVFDLDGTLLNTIEDLANSMNSVLKAKGYPVHDIEAYKYFVGDGMRTLVERALPEDKRNAAAIDEGLSAMQAEYARRWAEKTTLYPGIASLLDGLNETGINCAVLSNKQDTFTKQVVEKFLADWPFYPVFGERQGVPKKPDPAGALEIARILETRPEECLYLGDSGVDMRTANAAGMYAVGVLWGFRKADELLENGAKALVADPLQVLEML